MDWSHIKNACIERVVMENGQLIIPASHMDFDNNGNFLRSQFMEKHKEAYDIAREFGKKYNPSELPFDEYISARIKGKLSWQS